MSENRNKQPDLTRTCDECGSAYIAPASRMMNLGPECAHILYGYPNCEHVFRGGKCVKCLWNGSRSEYLRELLDQHNR